MYWKPHVTVAAIIEKEQRFLLVEEQASSGVIFTQPGGHLEEGEDLEKAIKREVYEETAWHFMPNRIVSVQLWRDNPQADSFLRVYFSGWVYNYDAKHHLDEGIIQTHWFTRDEVAAKQSLLRSPLVINTIDEYLKGMSYPLSLLKANLNS